MVKRYTEQSVPMNALSDQGDDLGGFGGVRRGAGTVEQELVFVGDEGVTEIRAYGTQRYCNVALSFFARSSSIRCAMKAVSPGG